MTDFVKAITELFLVMFNSIRKAPGTTALVFSMFFIGYYTLSNNDLLRDTNTPVEIEQTRFKKIVVANDEITNNLEETRVRTKATRILIRQFHNGKRGISGIPFTFVQTTYAVSAAGRGLGDQEAWLSYPISSMSSVLSEMFRDGYSNPKCAYIDINEVEDDYYRVYLERYNVEIGVKCPLIDKNGSVVGFIGAGFDRGQYTKAEMMLGIAPTIDRLGRHVVDKLDIAEGEKKHWWEFWK